MPAISVWCFCNFLFINGKLVRGESMSVLMWIYSLQSVSTFVLVSELGNYLLKLDRGESISICPFVWEMTVRGMEEAGERWSLHIPPPPLLDPSIMISDQMPHFSGTIASPCHAHCPDLSCLSIQHTTKIYPRVNVTGCFTHLCLKARNSHLINQKLWFNYLYVWKFFKTII